MTWEREGTGACMGLHVLRISRNPHYEVITNVIFEYVWAWIIFIYKRFSYVYPVLLLISFRTKSLSTPWNIFTGVSALELCNLLPYTHVLSNDRIYNRRREVNTLSKKIKASNSFKSLNIFVSLLVGIFKANLKRIPFTPSIP